jgi:adenosylcobinamide hydrolase
MKDQILETGGTLTADKKAFVCRFSSPRLVLSTSLYNGGFLQADAVFNYRLGFFVDSEADLPGGSMECYLAIVAEQCGLPLASSTGLLTGAHMDCRGYGVGTYQDIIVEVIATAGIDKNAVRAGDAGTYCESHGVYQTVGGTINIFAFTNVKLSQGAMAKALIGITEAKTAVLQELAVVSSVTLNLATGTGTDGIIVACNPASTLIYKDTGTQSKLGELFCRAVKSAVSQSLAKECATLPGRQGTIEQRLKRLGLDNSCSIGTLGATARGKLVLAMSQAIWQEYCWGLLGIEELYQFFELLDAPLFRPQGSILASALRQKLAVLMNQELSNR